MTDDGETRYVTARGSAQAAENRAKRQQQEQLRKVAEEIQPRIDAAVADALARERERINQAVADAVARERARQRQAEEEQRLAEARERFEQDRARWGMPKESGVPREVFYGRDPRHDPTVIALACAGRMDEANARIRELEAQQAQAARQQEVRSGFMWQTRQGNLFDDDVIQRLPAGGLGMPPTATRQRSTDDQARSREAEKNAEGTA